MQFIQFTRNHDDLSTDRGFQFKFYCDKCRNGFLSSFVTSKIGMTTSILQTVGSIFGGLSQRVGDSSYEIRRAVLGKEHDAAFQNAVELTKRQFKNCSRCGDWVCAVGCWNDSRGLCERCAPNIHEERAAAEAEAEIHQVRENAKDAKKRGMSTASCPSCSATSTGGSFCSACGAAFVAQKHCPTCNSTLSSGALFCSDCGCKQV